MKKEQQPAFPNNDATLLIPEDLFTTQPEAALKLARIKNAGKGLSIRQYYAAKAMQSLLLDFSKDEKYRFEDIYQTAFNSKHIAAKSFAVADAMIAFEEKEGKE